MHDKNDAKMCPCCNQTSQIFHYDTVGRQIRNENGKIAQIRVLRNKCRFCGHIYRMLPDSVIPFKQYRAEIIYGVVKGTITANSLDFEDYPSELTMRRWILEFHRG